MLTRIRNSKPISLAVAASFCVLACFCFYAIGFITQSALTANLARAFVFLVGGWIIVGRKTIGLDLTKHSFRRLLPYALFPLVAILLINVFGTQIKLEYLSRIDFGRAMGTGLWEEAIFRGALLGFLLRMSDSCSCSRLFSVGLSSLLFASAHGQSAEFFVYQFGLGIMFAVVVLQTQSLLFVVMLHALNNGLSQVMGGSLDEQTKVFGMSLLAFLSLCLVCGMADADQTTNPSENRQSV